MIKSLANSDTNAKLILIADSAPTSGKNIFKAFLKNYAKTEKIKLITCEQTPASLIDETISNKIDCVNIFSDPLQWLNSEPPEDNPRLSLASISKTISELQDSVVFIDSLNPFIWGSDIVNVAQDLSVLLKTSKKVVCCIHKDSLLQANVVQLASIATSFIDVLTRLDRKEDKYLMGIKLRKQDGRLDRCQFETVTIDDSLNVMSSVSMAQKEQKIQRTVDMESLTTFNLGVEMKPSEKEARDRLVLPYTKKDGGDVVYEADDADLEEDPDDDLEL